MTTNVTSALIYVVTILNKYSKCLSLRKVYGICVQVYKHILYL